MTITATGAQSFLDARDAYRSARNEQRLLIVGELKRAGFDVKTRGSAGRGLRTYSSGRRLTPPFDLSNWMWVEAARGANYVTVSLQVLDQDPSSLNIHALVDRIGIFVYREGDVVDENDPLFETATTSLELPLSEEDLAEIVSTIEAKILAAS